MSRNNDDAGGIYKVETVPPPAGSGDAYTAPTKVGPMTPALVQEMMHAAKAKAEAKAEEKKRSAASAAATARHPRFAGVPVGVVARTALGPPIPRVDVPEPPEPSEPPRVVVEEPIFLAPTSPVDIAQIVAPVVVPPASPPVVPVLEIDPLPELPLALPPAALLSLPSSAAPPPPSAPAIAEPLPSVPAPPVEVARRARVSFGRVVLVAAAALLACGLAIVMYVALTRGWHVRLRF